jgi:hypothetical protein
MSQMPPTNISATDLWMQITAMPRPHRIVDFPRTDPNGQPVAQVAIVVLTQQESFAVSTSTERFVKKMLKDNGATASRDERSDGYETLYETRACIEILWRACKKADDPTKNFFPTVEAIAQLTTDEVGVLFRAYGTVRIEIGPVVQMMTQEEYDAWIERLAVGGSAVPLSFMTLAAQTELLMYSARQLHASRMDNSSPTRPLDESGDEPSTSNAAE